MTPPTPAEIEARLKAASPGPWKADALKTWCWSDPLAALKDKVADAYLAAGNFENGRCVGWFYEKVKVAIVALEEYHAVALRAKSGASGTGFPCDKPAPKPYTHFEGGNLLKCVCQKCKPAPNPSQPEAKP